MERVRQRRKKRGSEEVKGEEEKGRRRGRCKECR